MSDLKANLDGFSYSKLKGIKNQLDALTDPIFNDLTLGKQISEKILWLDSDPFHDKNPRRCIRLTATLEVR